MTKTSCISSANATRLINLRNKESYTKYIGRQRGHNHHYGNPFIIGVHGSRNEVIRMFDFWIQGVAYTNVESRRREWILQNLASLEGEILACWCHPLPCHGDVYIQILKEMKEGKCIKV